MKIENNLNNNGKYKIKLDYFKESGKYYTSGEYYTNEEWMFDVEKEIIRMKNSGKLPGVSGSSWDIYVDASEHPNGCPMLIKDRVKY